MFMLAELSVPGKALDAKIDDLYEYRDKYYLNWSLANDADFPDDLQTRRNAEVKAALDRLLTEIDASLSPDDDDDVNTRWQRLFLIGKAINVTPDYDQRAYDALTRSIKLEPRFCESWNALAETYWKVGSLWSEGNKRCSCRLSIEQELRYVPHMFRAECGRASQQDGSARPIDGDAAAHEDSERQNRQDRHGIDTGKTERRRDPLAARREHQDGEGGRRA